MKIRSRQFSVGVYLFLSSLPIVSGLIFLNYITFKILNAGIGSKLAAVTLAISSLVSLINIVISTKLEKLMLAQKLYYAAALTFFSSLCIALLGCFPPADYKNYLIFTAVFFINCLIQQIKSLLLFKVPYILSSEQIFTLNKSTSFSLIVERSFRGLAPGLALIILNYDWLQVCSLYAFINILSVFAIYILSYNVFGNDFIQKHNPATKTNNKSAEKEELYFKKISNWNNVFQLFVNAFLAPATFIFLIAIKSNNAFQDWILTPLTFLYGGLLFISLGAYSKLLKKFIQPPFNPLMISASYVLLLGILFLFLSLASNLLFWVISFFIGLVYGLLLLINSNSILKILNESKHFLKYISHAQLCAVLSTMPTFVLSGYAIEYGISYNSLFGIIGIGCIVSSIILYIFIPKDQAKA